MGDEGLGHPKKGELLVEMSLEKMQNGRAQKIKNYGTAEYGNAKVENGFPKLVNNNEETVCIQFTTGSPE
jgi:hypothetical protein